MIQISNIKVLLDEDKEQVIAKTIKKLTGKVHDYKIVRESIDARRGIVFVYTIYVDVKPSQVLKSSRIDYSVVEEKKPTPIVYGEQKLQHRPVIIGFGPAGMFAALELARNGYRPVVYERGSDVDKRTKDVELFWKMGKLNPESNVQFGEGGAGTFSDGKLTTRIKDPNARKVLEALYEFGAPEEILYASKPHIGTDILVNVVKNIREEIKRLGGEIHFDAKLEDIEIQNKKIRSIVVNGERIESDVIVLAIGHSARETYRLLYERAVEIRKKPFAVGFRVEHPQVVIDKAQFKENFAHPKLKASEYHLTHTAETGRGCYTFCMCPGGRVIASASSENQVVVNGMSYHARDLQNANSAILCSVLPEDFGEHPLSAMEFQEAIERKSFEMGGENYFAPIQRVGDYLRKQPTTELGEVIPSYEPGYRFARLDGIYPDFIYESLAESIAAMGEKLKGFSMEDAILTGVETRTSAPIRIVRGDELESVSTQGLYPCGEGAGYAGGIVSAAVDGIKVALSIMKKFCR
ncbi:MAG: FAD-dependent oxidoreductase [Peptostreptococcaceae bacterium]|nr:FAD-dependent oxidoreductase [Peptostreptococcaceae bacterium]